MAANMSITGCDIGRYLKDFNNMLFKAIQRIGIQISRDDPHNVILSVNAKHTKTWNSSQPIENFQKNKKVFNIRCDWIKLLIASNILELMINDRLIKIDRDSYNKKMKDYTLRNKAEELNKYYNMVNKSM